jgi:signal transduction histidine kinase
VLRVLAVPLALVLGSGALLYLVAWIVLPRPGERSILRNELADRAEGRNALAVATAALGGLLGLQALGLHRLGTVAWPLMLGVVGLFVVWRGAGAEERTDLRQLIERAPVFGIDAGRSRRTTIVRVALGIALTLGGLGGVASITRGSSVATRGFLGAIAVVGGFLVIFGPWWLRLWRELTEERRDRVRAEERADMAAHIHDSVLQTLTLIQKSANDPGEVARLARAQERELRSWLFKGVRPGDFARDNHTVALAVAAVEAEVEDAHGVEVESVVVGDCALEEPLPALLAAGREALVNAAKWSGAPVVSLFVEVEADSVSLFVRDRGCGFDPAMVGAGHNGLANSVHDRMTRHGGTASVRSDLGVGTEVALVMPRKRRSE